MVTCYIKYTIDPFKKKEFEHYAQLWMPLVEKFGGKHHGYFLPHEGADNIALALFSFSSLSEYESYRTKAAQDKECLDAMAYYERTRCFLSYDRTFMKPMLE